MTSQQTFNDDTGMNWHLLVKILCAAGPELSFDIVATSPFIFHGIFYQFYFSYGAEKLFHVPSVKCHIYSLVKSRAPGRQSKIAARKHQLEHNSIRNCGFFLSTPSMAWISQRTASTTTVTICRPGILFHLIRRPQKPFIINLRLSSKSKLPFRPINLRRGRKHEHELGSPC